MLAHFADAVRPEPRPLPDETQQRLEALLVREPTLKWVDEHANRQHAGRGQLGHGAGPLPGLPRRLEVRRPVAHVHAHFERKLHVCHGSRLCLEPGCVSERRRQRLQLSLLVKPETGAHKSVQPCHLT